MSETQRETMPTALDVNFDDVYEFELIPDGEEAQFRITFAEIAKSENSGRINLHIVVDIPENPRIDDIHAYITTPMPDDDEKKVNKIKRRLQDFYKCIGAEFGQPVEMEQIKGAMGWAIFGEETDPEYGARNRVRSFIVPA